MQTVMEAQRAGTSHSQRTLIPLRQLEHSAPEVVEQPEPVTAEKGEYSAPTYPPAFQEQPQRNSHWSLADVEALPPKYSAPHPGPPTNDPASLVVPPMEQSIKRDETICGLRRKRFVVLLAVAGLILLGIGVGVGVGVGIGGDHSSGKPPAATSAPAGDSCPGISSTQVRASNGKRFLHLCNLDYSGANEAIDIGNVRTSTFTECIEACSRRDDCQGVGWGPPNNVNKARGTCYMKRSLKTSHEATADWNFAVLLDNL